MMSNRFAIKGKRQPTYTLNAQALTPSEFLTVPVIGIPRGGTSLVASVLHSLGIYMGPLEELAQYKFEDQTMNKAHTQGQSTCIKLRNRRHNRWGWKDPTAVHTVQSLLSCLRNPRVILVLRDPLASVQGEMRLDKVDEYEPRTFQDLMSCTVSWMQANLDFIRTTASPVLLVSYERAMKQPVMFLDELIVFLGIQPKGIERIRASQCIGSDGGYIVTNKDWEAQQ